MEQTARLKITNELPNTMNTQIENIAETLRGFINTDNDAKRLIAEAVFPLLGLPGSVDAVERMFDAADTMADVAADLERIIEDMEYVAESDDDTEMGKFAARISEQVKYLTAF